MKIVMFGTGPFAVPTFSELLTSHEVVALVTRPIDDAGKRRKSAANPMRELAEARELAVFAPSDANEVSFVDVLRQINADLFVVCDFGQILSKECLAAARLGGVNLHGSLLPRYRGAAPINWAIYRGETTTGVSVIHMTSKLDGGPVLNTATLPIETNDTTESIEPRLSQLGVQPVLDSIGLLTNWDGTSAIGVLQDPALATSARRLRKEDGWIRWQRSAQQIVNQVRAFQPWPGTFTEWLRPESTPIRLIINAACVYESHVPSSGISDSPGTVIKRDRDSLVVQTGQGQLELMMVQPAGKKSMPIDAFLRGYPIAVGQLFAGPINNPS